MYVVPLKLPTNYPLYPGGTGITPKVGMPHASRKIAKDMTSLVSDFASNEVWRWESDIMGQQIKSTSGAWYSSLEHHRLGYDAMYTDHEYFEAVGKAAYLSKYNGSPVRKDGIVVYLNPYVPHKRITYHSTAPLLRPQDAMQSEYTIFYKVRSGAAERDADWRVLAEDSRTYIEDNLIPKEYHRPIFCYQGYVGYYLRVIRRPNYDQYGKEIGLAGSGTGTGTGIPEEKEEEKKPVEKEDEKKTGEPEKEPEEKDADTDGGEGSGSGSGSGSEPLPDVAIFFIVLGIALVLFGGLYVYVSKKGPFKPGTPEPTAGSNGALDQGVEPTSTL